MSQFGISDSLVYNAKPRAAAAQKLRISQPPLNGGTTAAFSPTQTIQISVPCGSKGQYLNTRQSYLKFKINNKDLTSTNKLKLDYSASAFIRLLEVDYGSNTLEYIDQYNVLYHLLNDTQSVADKNVYSGNVLEGMDESKSRVGIEIDGGTSLTVCVPLLSGVVGTLQNKYLPIGDMVRNHLRLQLTLADTNEPQVSASAVEWDISDVEFVMEVVQLNSETAKAISAMNSSGYTIPMHTFSVHSNSIESGTQNANILISGNYRSLKTLMTVFRKQTNLSSGTIAGLSLRTNPFSDSNSRWQYNIGGQMVPQKPVMSRAEAYAELMKAFHAFGTLENVGVIDKATWDAAEGSYVIAQDLETQSHKSMLAEAGIDVSSTTIHLVCDFPTALTAALRADTFSHQDAVLLIDSTGMAQTVF